MRSAFVRDLTLRTFTVIAVLIGSVALVVWFGVSLGLRPLLDLEDAISRRSSDDLKPIQRAVPTEARGLVQRLNTLFGQVDRAMEAQNTLISNAAHQLRNPIAGVLSMAEAVRSAPTDAEARRRAEGLLEAARRSSDLANKLLTLERVRAAPMEALQSEVALGPLVSEIIDSYAGRVSTSVTLACKIDHPPMVVADHVMVREAITNLVDNALRHGGGGLARVELHVTALGPCALITVRDDGVGIEAGDVERALARFGQAQTSDRSGLGLSIAAAVAERHGGALDLDTSGAGLSVTLTLPASRST